MKRDNTMPNPTIQAQLRKLNSTLAISGLGIILFCCWSFLKAVLQLSLQWEYYKAKFVEVSDDPTALLFIILFTVVVLCIIFWFHLFTGFSALRRARGMKYRRGYPIVACIMALFSFISIAEVIVLFQNMEYTLVECVASLLLEFTFLYILFDLLRAGIKLNRLTCSSDQIGG